MDRAIYLPQEWTDHQERGLEAGVPEEVEFATKLVLARRMLQRVLESLGAQLRPEQPADLQAPQRSGCRLIPSTLPEVLHLVWSLVWQQVVAHAHAVAWSFFRRHHQAVAKACHYKRRVAATPT